MSFLILRQGKLFSSRELVEVRVEDQDQKMQMTIYTD